MRNLDMNKIAGLRTADALLDIKYGKEGSAQRQRFDAESKAWYASQLEKSTYSITMPIELHKSLSQRASQMGQSISAYVSHLLAQDLQLA